MCDCPLNEVTRDTMDLKKTHKQDITCSCGRQIYYSGLETVTYCHNCDLFSCEFCQPEKVKNFGGPACECLIDSDTYFYKHSNHWYCSKCMLKDCEECLKENFTTNGCPKCFKRFQINDKFLCLQHTKDKN